MVCNPSSWEPKAGGFLRVGGQPELHGKTLRHNKRQEETWDLGGVDFDLQLKMAKWLHIYFFLPKTSLKCHFLLKAKG